jgi:hypothetical protein
LSVSSVILQRANQPDRPNKALQQNRDDVLRS